MPNSLMEAMAMGLVCVSTSCPTGPSDLITSGENGFLVPVGDYKLLAQTIETLWNLDKERIGAISEAAHLSMIRKYDANSIAFQWKDVFDQVLVCNK